MTKLLKDLRYSARVLRRNPGFTVAFVLTLALGIGGNTAFFSFVHGILLRPLPYPEPDAIVYFHWKSEHGTTHASSAEKLLFWNQQSSSFSALAAHEMESAGATLMLEKDAFYVRSLRVSSDFFSVLGVQPTLGRGFLPEEDQPGGPNVTVLSHGLWKHSFGNDPGIINQTVRLGEEAFQVVGVMPPNLRFEPESDLLVPLRATAGAQSHSNIYSLLGRLEPGVSLEQAQSETDSLFSAFVSDYPEVGKNEVSALLGPYSEWIVGDLEEKLLLLFCAGLLVFMICCINLSNLVVARSYFQTGEIATRVVIGARWPDVFRQTIIECLLIALIGTLAGWVLARIIVPLMLSLSPTDLPSTAEIGVGPVEVLFAGLATLLAVVLVALAPTIRVARGNLASELKLLTGGKTAIMGVSRRWFGRLVVVSQVAISLAVVMAAWVLIGSFQKLIKTDPGFTAADVMTFQLPLRTDRYLQPEPAHQLSEQILQRLRQLPGAESAAVVSSLPLEPGLNVPLHIEGHAEPVDTEIEYRAISPDYFQCLGIQLLKGRELSAQDANEAPVAIVNQTLARQYWSEDRAVGETVWVAKEFGALADHQRRIVGVVGDTYDLGLDEPAKPMVYVPQAQVPEGLGMIVNQAFPLGGVIKLRGDTGVGLSEIREVVKGIDPHQAVTNVRWMREVIATSVIRERFYASLLGLFGTVAVLLTALGIYGVVNSHVSQRIFEIGLRLAVGARGRHVLTMVLGESFWLTLVGVGAGIPIAYGLNRLISNLVAGTAGNHLLSLIVVALFMLSLAILASLSPAWRASQADPMRLLRAS
jgi:predicted permease